ncbi:hypothetical protein ACGK9R_16110 [Halomonas sp. HNIBRBA4712]|uniref:hypothetical protein n=1 Tax=Halomonas sp. HNIBRBA4712 TaxID=3373087 RepID=UPI0037472481
MSESGIVTLDDVEYSLNELDNAAKLQLKHLHQADQEIARLKQQIAITRTARTAYVEELVNELPE